MPGARLTVPMTAEKSERLVKLLAFLLASARPRSADEIRDKIDGYEDHSDDAFHRMFERDKQDLRALGYRIEHDEGDLLGRLEGYRIRRDEALLERSTLRADEWAALSLASQAWGGSGDGFLGLLKLSAVSGASGPSRPGWLLPRVEMDRNATTLMDAIHRRKRVRFSYRAPGSEDVSERAVEPWGLYHRGAWYLVGRDVVRGERRSFKLARVRGRIELAARSGPADFEPPPPEELRVIRGPWEGEAKASARIAFAPEAAWWVERRTGAHPVEERPDGWIEVEIPVADLDAFAGWLAGFADRAVALEPPELREAMVARMRALAAR